MRRNFRPRKKVDPFVKDPSKVIDYKDIETLKRFISDRGKILPRRVTGLNAKHQREITRVKMVNLSKSKCRSRKA